MWWWWYLHLFIFYLLKGTSTVFYNLLTANYRKKSAELWFVYLVYLFSPFFPWFMFGFGQTRSVLIDIVLSFWSLPSKTHKLGIFHSVAKGIEVSFGIFAVDFQWLMIVLLTFNFCPVQFPLSKMPGIMTAQPQSQRLHTCTIKSA